MSLLTIAFLITNINALPAFNESQYISVGKRAEEPNFKILLTGVVASISSILAPNTGKVIQIERITDGRAGTTHSQEIDIQSARARPLVLPADSWCSGGFISPEPSGRVVNIAGFSGDALDNNIDFISCGTPGNFGNCDWRNLATIKSSTLLRYRWYPTALPLPSGRVAVISGSTSATGLVPPPTFESNMEFIPRLPNENVVPIKLLADTINDSLYPIAHVLSNGNVFLMSGKSSGLYNPNTFQPIGNINLPNIAGKRTYPYGGGSVLLQLLPENNYLSEVLVCGGSPGETYSANIPALNDCGRISPLSTNPTWKMFNMNFKRVIPDMVILPNGNIFIVNGASLGVEGFNTQSQPVFTSEIYNPISNVITKSATSNIARLYHSEALLLEDGRVMISGSTPNGNANAKNTIYPDELRIEVYTPDYLGSGLPRPIIKTLSSKTWAYWQVVKMTATIPSGNTAQLTASLFTNGFVTHSLHMGQRSVRLNIKVINADTFEIIAPPNANVVPPGWYMLFIMDGPTPAVAQWIQVGGDPAGMALWPSNNVTPPAPTTCTVAVADRVDCGIAGYTETQCVAKGCCWNPLTVPGPWCFNPGTANPQPPATSCTVDKRVDCGFAGINQAQCIAKGCCWGALTVPGPWCFNPGTTNPPPPTSCTVEKRVDCGFAGMNQAQCVAKGCCWGPLTVPGPWCFNPGTTNPPPPTSCTVDKRVDCGFSGMNQAQCVAKGCCWGPLTVPGPWCFQPA